MKNIYHRVVEFLDIVTFEKKWRAALETGIIDVRYLRNQTHAY